MMKLETKLLLCNLTTLAASIAVIVLVIADAKADTPRIYDSQSGVYLGDYSSSTIEPNSVSNSAGFYGSTANPLSINNPVGNYGSAVSPSSINNTLSITPPIIIHGNH